MVIYLDRSLSNVLTGDLEASERDWFLFSDLLSADYNADHSIFIDAQLTADILSHSPDPRQRRWLMHIDSRTTMLASLAAYVDHVLVLASGDLQSLRLPSCIDTKKVVVDWTVFERSMLSKSILLGENLDDCKFYSIIAKYYLSRNRINGYECACEHNGGGGNTTSLTYKNHVLSQHKLCLCIADSDKHFDSPSAPRGNTLSALIAVQRHIEHSNMRFLGKLIALPVLEAENLIPLSVLRCCFSKDCNCQQGLGILEQFSNFFPDDEHNPALFYDLKKGLRAKHCASSVNSETVRYWRQVFSDMGDEIVTDYDDTPLPDEKKDCVIRAGISNNNLLRKVIQHIDSPTLAPNLSEIFVDGYLLELWDMIGRAIFTWSCAPVSHSS